MLRKLIHTGLVVAAVAAIAGVASAAVGRGEEAGSFAASFEARAVADPTLKACRSLPAVQKLEGRYRGTMTVNGEELELNFSLETLVDRSTGLGTAEGKWQLAQPPEPDIVARGTLLAVVNMVSPPDPELQLRGLLIGTIDPPDPDRPAQQLLGNFTGSITDGTLNFAGAVGDPTGLESNPAVLLPAVKC